tara:strand:+ start:227 stop:808 length:582 start_codon:yes stop_codon:yes gene_type:complete
MKKKINIKKVLTITIPLIITFLLYILYSGQLFKSSFTYNHSNLQSKFFKMLSNNNLSSEKIKKKNYELNEGIKKLILCIQYPNRKFTLKRDVLQSLSLEGGYFLPKNSIEKVIINYNFNNSKNAPRKIILDKIEKCIDSNIEFKIITYDLDYDNLKNLIIKEFIPQKFSFNFFDILSGIFSSIILGYFIYRIV